MDRADRRRLRSASPEPRASVGGFDGSFQPDFDEPRLRALYQSRLRGRQARPRAAVAAACAWGSCTTRRYATRWPASPRACSPSSAPDGSPSRCCTTAPTSPCTATRTRARSEGSVAGLVPVYNVAVPVMKRDFWLFELRGTRPEVPAHVEVQSAGLAIASAGVWANWTGDRRCSPRETCRSATRTASSPRSAGPARRG